MMRGMRFELVRSGRHMLVAGWEKAGEDSGGEWVVKDKERAKVEEVEVNSSTAWMIAYAAMIVACLLLGWQGALMVGLLMQGAQMVGLLLMVVAVTVPLCSVVSMGWKKRQRTRVVGLLGAATAAAVMVPGMHPVVHGLRHQDGDRFKPALGHISFVGERSITLG